MVRSLGLSLKKRSSKLWGHFIWIRKSWTPSSFVALRIRDPTSGVNSTSHHCYRCCTKKLGHSQKIFTYFSHLPNGLSFWSCRHTNDDWKFPNQELWENMTFGSSLILLELLFKLRQKNPIQPMPANRLKNNWKKDLIFSGARYHFQSKKIGSLLNLFGSTILQMRRMCAKAVQHLSCIATILTLRSVWKIGGIQYTAFSLATVQ